MYGQQGEWKTQYRDSRPGSARPIISSGGAQREGGTVLSVARYQHCATITGQYPDHNLLHDLPLSNLHQQCRDDEMHMFRLGIMLHMFSGLCARCTGRCIRKSRVETVSGRRVLPEYLE